ncbi:trigger factor [Thiocapsa roseopersicina]|uniref:Trigger factor n=2 Tax=Thiocapsa roseopersicina TaxID=1058 RepID=A0A1H2Q1Y1_THIRO|nr:trigger factor [Thiocapsa roseopersicina]SDW01113.1 trigger factor [Thiocapsa roseopersicina]
MQVSVDTGEGLERRMKIDLPFEQIAAEVEKRLQKLGRSARMPGFRPGKVPMKVLRQRYGEAVHQEVFGELVESSFSEALMQESLRPAGMPRIEPEIDPVEQRFGYTAIFEVLPQVEVASLAGRVVKSPVAEISDEDIDAMVMRLRRQHATRQPVERAAATGDLLTISFVGTLDGEPFEGGSATGVKLELGSGRMIPGFEDGLIGACAGDQRTLDLVFPDPYQAEHLAGKPVRFEVTVETVEESVLPEVDATFVEVFGVADGDIARFRQDVRQNMEREMKQRLDARRKDAVMDLLLEAHEIELPAVLVAEEIRAMKGQMLETLGSKGMALPDGMFEEAAKRRVSLGLIIGEIVKRQGLRPDAQRVRAAVEENASTYEHPQAVVDYFYSDPKHLASVESLVLEGQVVDWVLGQVEVEEEVLTFAQLSESGPRPGF